MPVPPTIAAEDRGVQSSGLPAPERWEVGPADRAVSSSGLAREPGHWLRARLSPPRGFHISSSSSVPWRPESAFGRASALSTGPVVNHSPLHLPVHGASLYRPPPSAHREKSR